MVVDATFLGGVVMNVKKQEVLIVLTPEGGEHENLDVYLPYVQTIRGSLYYPDPAVTVRDGQGLVLGDLIPSLQEVFSCLTNRPCTIGAESSCLYVTDSDAVYEVGMFNAHRRFLREILPSGEYGDLLCLIGAIFCSDTL